MDGIPDKALSTIDVNKYVKILKINNFRDCYLRDELKNLNSNNVECGILNLN